MADKRIIYPLEFKSEEDKNNLRVVCAMHQVTMKDFILDAIYEKLKRMGCVE